MTREVRDINRTPKAIAGILTGINQGLEEVGDEMLERIDRGFEHGEDALGRSWEPLSPETIRNKGHSDILQESGDLRESFHRIEGMGGRTIRVGSDSELLAYHEFGVPERNLPARPVLEPAAIWAEKEVLDESVAEAVNRRLTVFL